MPATSRNVAAECRDTENVEPGTSRQHTGISVSVAPSRWQLAISSTSKAKPAVRSGSAAAPGQRPGEELEPALGVGGVRARPGGPARGTPPRRSAGYRCAAPRPPRPASARDPMTRWLPGDQQAERQVERGQVGGHVRVAEPDERRPGGQQARRAPRRPLPGRVAAQQPDRHRAGGPGPHHIAGPVGARAVHDQDGGAQRERGRLPAQRGQAVGQPARPRCGPERRSRSTPAGPPAGPLAACPAPRPPGQRVPY